MFSLINRSINIHNDGNDGFVFRKISPRLPYLGNNSIGNNSIDDISNSHLDSSFDNFLNNNEITENEDTQIESGDTQIENESEITENEDTPIEITENESEITENNDFVKSLIQNLSDDELAQSIETSIQKYNHPLMLAYINTLEEINYDETIHTYYDACPISFTEFKEGDYIKMLPCNHYFEPESIEEWFNHSSRCPVCNYNILSKM